MLLQTLRPFPVVFSKLFSPFSRQRARGLYSVDVDVHRWHRRCPRRSTVSVRPSMEVGLFSTGSACDTLTRGPVRPDLHWCYLQITIGMDTSFCCVLQDNWRFNKVFFFKVFDNILAFSKIGLSYFTDTFSRSSIMKDTFCGGIVVFQSVSVFVHILVIWGGR